MVRKYRGLEKGADYGVRDFIHAVLKVLARGACWTTWTTHPCPPGKWWGGVLVVKIGVLCINTNEVPSSGHARRGWELWKALQGWKRHQRLGYFYHAFALAEY